MSEGGLSPVSIVAIIVVGDGMFGGKQMKSRAAFQSRLNLVLVSSAMIGWGDDFTLNRHSLTEDERRRGHPTTTCIADINGTTTNSYRNENTSLDHTDFFFSSSCLSLASLSGQRSDGDWSIWLCN
jgi:hypothetical protein